MDGILIIDKPTGMTSHDVVNRVRRITKERSVGHLGTLDPMATGVLPLLLGRMTRLAQFYLGAEKEYEGEIRFGFATDTYDAEGEPLGPAQAFQAGVEEIRNAAKKFLGSIEQTPPPFSAKKIKGVPAYKLARSKKPVEIKPATVEVRELEIVAAEGDRARFRARVAAGTYLRSIAHDLGRKLGYGAHLAQLRRTRVAEFGLAESHSLEELAGICADLECPITDITLTIKNIRIFLHPRAILPQFPSVNAPEETLARLMHGNPVNLPEFGKAPLVKIFYGQNELVAIGKRVAGTLFQPKIVLVQSLATSATTTPR